MTCSVFPTNGVAHMMRRALNTLDYRLMDHGERVAYLVVNMMRSESRYTDNQLMEACYLGMFHDIGAYKTELIDSLLDVDKLFAFEIKNSLPHSIYSYLFLRDISFLQEFVDAVLFHHFTYPKLVKSDCRNIPLAAKLFIADRIDLLIAKGLASSAADVFRFLDNPVFCQENVVLLRRLEEEQQTVSKIFATGYLDELFTFINAGALDKEQVASLVEMLPYTIDFRSVNTVTHTAATVEITLAIADLLGISGQDKESLYYGALLHDIGKISTSLMILEKQGKLTDLEFNVMQDHVLLSEYILKGRVSEEVFLIAIRHHEKLDGSGYPYGLKDADLTRSQRIVAVADILSALLGKRSYKEPFPEETVRSIVSTMSADGKICPAIAALVLENYADIAHRVEGRNRDAVTRYATFTDEFSRLAADYSTQI